jgi:hypothetical protein
MNLGKNGKEFIVWTLIIMINLSLWIVYFMVDPNAIETEVLPDGDGAPRFTNPYTAGLAMLNLLWIIGLVGIRIIAPQLNGRGK